MAKLADILKQEYQSKGVVGGLASATGKRALEKLDIRNALFGGSGVGSLIGRKIFGKGYSAIGDKSSSADKLSSQSAPGLSAQSDKLDTIGTNTQISAKNSMAIPSMARDMNVMRQNISKLVKLQGGTPTNKADAFFSKAKDRESMYESLFGKKDKTTPTKVTEKDDSKGIIGTILSTLALGASKLFDTLKTTIGSVTTIFGDLIGKLPGLLPALSTLFEGAKLAIGLILSPLGLLTAGLIAATAAIKFFSDKILSNAEKEGGEKGKEVAEQSIGETMSGAMDGNFVTGTNSYGEKLAGPDERAQAIKEHQQSLKALLMAPYKTRAGTGRDTTPTKVEPIQPGTTFNQLTKEQQDLFLKNQAQAEGSYKAGTIGNRHNNPGNIIAKSSTEVYPAQAKFGGVPGETITDKTDGKTRTFVRFPTWEAGVEAQRDLWTRRYGDTPITQALTKWVDPSSNAEMANYQMATLGGNVKPNMNAPQTNTTGSTLNQSSTQVATLTREAQSGSNVTNNNVVNNNGGGQQGAPVQIAMADVVDYELGRLMTRMYS